MSDPPIAECEENLKSCKLGEHELRWLSSGMWYTDYFKSVVRKKLTHVHIIARALEILVVHNRSCAFDKKINF